MGKLDLVVYGATGFTGRLAAKYLAGKGRRLNSGVKWALAGRSLPKLENLRDELCDKDPSLASLQLLEADSSDQSAVDAMVKDCKALVTTAGPYAQHGSYLLRSCANHGTHYADLTGEIPWIKKMMDNHHEAALKSGAAIIPSCGFGSVPSGWGVWAIVQHFQQTLGEGCAHVDGYCVDIAAGLSGGTADSMFGPEYSREVRDALKDPQYLNPPDKRTNRDSPDAVDVSYDAVLKKWRGIFYAAPINSRNIRRSAALGNYGSNFSYSEHMLYNNRVAAFLGNSAFRAFTKAGENPQSWNFLRYWMPDAGSGPSQKDLHSGYAKMRFVGESEKSKSLAQCDITIHGEPGYLQTATMLCEAGLHMAENCNSIPSGFTTPSVALGAKYYDRLLKNGFEMSVKPIPRPES